MKHFIIISSIVLAAIIILICAYSVFPPRETANNNIIKNVPHYYLSKDDSLAIRYEESNLDLHYSIPYNDKLEIYELLFSHNKRPYLVFDSYYNNTNSLYDSRLYEARLKKGYSYTRPIEDGLKNDISLSWKKKGLNNKFIKNSKGYWVKRNNEIIGIKRPYSLAYIGFIKSIDKRIVVSFHIYNSPDGAGWYFYEFNKINGRWCSKQISSVIS